VQLGSGDLAGALRASPLALLGGPFVAALPLLRPRLPRVPGALQWTALGVLLALSELWQLHRAGLL
jgi:hypothetical protein